MIGVIDYGLGNIKAFLNVYERLGIEARRVVFTEDFKGVDRLILPGVGAFDHAMNQFNNSGVRDTVEKLVHAEGYPILGICVGMQMLASSSEEGVMQGLGWINGVVKKFDPKSIPFSTSLPHMGWNTVKCDYDEMLFRNIEAESLFYFLHSYYFESFNMENSISRTYYGIEYSSSVRNNNIYGVQFHPEKSHNNGIQILKNFSSI